jgi:invasion protein IalB
MRWLRALFMFVAAAFHASNAAAQDLKPSASDAGRATGMVEGNDTSAFSIPWTTTCLREDSRANGAGTCVTFARLKNSTGGFVGEAAVIEGAPDAQTLLRISVPLGTESVLGMRVSIDREAPRTPVLSAYMPKMFVAQFELSPPSLAAMKNGLVLRAELVTFGRDPATLAFPLRGLGRPRTVAEFKDEYRRRLQELETNRGSDRLIRCRTAVGAAPCAWEHYWERRK